MVEGQDLADDDLQVMAAASSATADIQQEHTADGASVHSARLRWIMEKVKTTPELLAERHSNPWFVLFLALCFPSMVAGMMVRCILESSAWVDPGHADLVVRQDGV